jgi:beta-carotene hydroxylase
MAFRAVLSLRRALPGLGEHPSHNLVHHHFDDDGQPDWAAPEHVGSGGTCST